MKEKFFPIIVLMLFLILLFPSQIFAESNENLDIKVTIEDRRWDVKLFGLFPNPAQFLFGSVDFINVSFAEDSSQPDELHVTMNLRDLSKLLPDFDSGYTVSWWMNNIHYCLVVHRLPSNQISQYAIGHSEEANDDIVQWTDCDGVFDVEQDCIKWTVLKEDIGNPSPFYQLTSIYATTFVRKIYDERSGADLFKDLAFNAKSSMDYVIKY